MMTRTQGSAPCDMLPPVRGTITRDAPLKDLVWFRAGGPAEVLFRPADADDLASFLAARPADLNVSVIGVGSNLLVRDGGIPGAVVRLSSAFGKVETYKNEDGGLHVRAGAADMAFEYRKAKGAHDGLIFIEAVFEGTKDEPAAIRARMEELSANREAAQPIKSKTGGSTFKNPPGHKAWQLVDDAGCRGLKIGGAQVSEKHTNFLINTGDATATDLEALGEEVRKRVQEKSGVTLEWEIKRVGVA